MSASERVTVSLPADVRQAAEKVAENTGVPFSNVVSEALSAWLRGRLLDEWLDDFQKRNGVFDEGELQALADEVGLPYLPPRRQPSAA